MSHSSAQTVTRIPLERPASVKRHLPSVGDDGWMLSEFIIGNENAALRHLFDESTIRDLGSISPVLLAGEKGTGKSALSITLAVRWARLTRSRPLCFSSGATFARDYAAAVEIDDIASFRQRHRECQLLIIDDLEPLASKPAAQDELIHTIDALAEEGAPLIVSNSKLPTSHDGFKSALASRLSAGLSVPLVRPSDETILAILETLAQQSQPFLQSDSLQAICHELALPLKVQDLGSIVTLARQNADASGTFDSIVVHRLAKQFLAGESLSTSTIAKVVARKMRVKLSDMRGSTREANIVRARGVAILLARRLTPASLQQIGHYFGGRDHSTILHACRKTELLVASDAELQNVVFDAQAELLNQ